VCVSANNTTRNQVIGKNVNTERNAASNRIADMSIERYFKGVKTMRTHVQKALNEASALWFGIDGVSVILVPVITQTTIR
jgi:hypothetical protein